MLAASAHEGVTMMPSDNFGNTWVTAVPLTSTTEGADLRTGVWYARNPIVGPGHTITLTMSTPEPLVMSVIVGKGSNIASPIDVASPMGSDEGTASVDVESPSIVTTAAYDLLIGFAKSGSSEIWVPGTGFTAQTAASSPYLFAETATAVTPGTYNAPIAIEANDTWQAAVIAVGPSAAAVNPQQVNLSWTASTESGGTVANYLIERCQGAGCSSFAQIGMTNILLYTDVSVSPGTTYSYRVRASDTTSNAGPYSNVVSATTPGSSPASPSIASVAPPSGLVGTAVTISGANFGTTQGTSTVTFNGTAAVPTSWSATSIVVPVPNGATTGNIVVTVGGQASNGAAFTVTVPSPSVSTLNPVSGPVATSVTITGANFGATQGTSSVTFNGVAAVPTSWSALSIVVPVPAGATTGNVLVTVGGQTSNAVAFTVTVPAPSISSLNPSSGSVGTAVSISGANFGATQGTSTVTFNGTTAAPSSWGSSSIVVSVPSGATSGNVIISVGGQTSNAVAFTVTVPAPSISTLSPASGPAGTAVTISGANFGATQGTSTVSFNGTLASVTSWGTASIVAVAPSTSSSGNVIVTVAGQTSNGVAFTFPAPSITSLSPSSGPVGTQVTITGTNFGSTGGTVTFNGVPVAGYTWTPTSISVQVPSGAATGNVVVTAGGLTSNGVLFTVATAPVISGLSPSFGSVGTPITIVGAGFGATQGSSSVSFNGVPATATIWSQTSITVKVPVGATSGSVTVTVFGLPSNGVPFTVTTISVSISPSSASVQASTSIGLLATVQNDVPNTGVTWSLSGAGCSGLACGMFNSVSSPYALSYVAPSVVPNPPIVTVTATSIADHTKSATASFTITPSPTITSVSPSSGPVGTLVTIIGTNFGATQGTSFVAFNSIGSTPTSWSSTSITVPVPTGATTGSLVLTLGGQPISGGTFTVTVPAPVISSLNPSSGLVGTAITIAGTNFGATQGTSTVKFNGTTATPASWSASSIVVPVPSGATTGNVVVTVGGQSSNSVAFTVTIPAPSISALNPTSGLVGTSVTITGANFGATQGTSTVTFNGITAAPTSWSTSSVAVPVPVGATTGNVVMTVGGQASNAVTFTVTVPAPSITTLSPTSGLVGTPVTIAGANFGATQGTSSVTFNGVAAVPTGWSASSIVVPVPTGATTGSVLVTVGSQTSNAAAFTVTVPAPSISTLNPTSGPVGTSVTIAGASFGAMQGTSTVKFNGTIATPSSWSVSSIVVPVPSGATSGNVVVTVGGQSSNAVAFTVTIPAPSITTLNPPSGSVGTSVTIAGANFGATQGTSTVKFNGTTATPTNWSASSIVVPVPTGATTGMVVVTVGAQTSNGVTFTVNTGSSSPTAPGSLTAVASSLTPSLVGEQGYINTAFLTSHSMLPFDSTGADLLVLFASSHAGVTFTPSDSFGNVWTSAVGPTNTSTGFDLRSQMWYVRNPIVGPNHVVTMGLSTGESLVLSVLAVKGSNKSSPLDAVTAIGDDNGTQSMNVVSPSLTTHTPNELLIGFAKVSSTSTFQAGTGFVQQNSASSAYLDAEVGLTATPGVYSATFSIGLPVTWQAVAAAVSPVAASNPNQINLAWIASTEAGGSISSYLVERCQGASCVNFVQIGSSATTTYADTTVTASTTYNYRVRAQDASGNLGPYSNTATATTPSGIPLPSITNLSPTSGTVGTSVTISGVNLGAAQGSSTVSFNGTIATPTSWSASSILVPVPAGATTGNVSVMVGGQISNAVLFTVLAPPPAITSLSPAYGPVGTVVTINGSNFGSTQATSIVSFNGTSATPTSWSVGTITVPVPTGATSGNIAVTVGGQISNSVFFTVGTTPPPGTITHLQQVSSSDMSGTSYSTFTATLPAPTTGGSAVVIGLTYGNSNATITVTDSQGNTYSPAVATYDAGHNQGCAILYAPGIRGNATDTVTLHFSSPLAYLGLGIHEYSGVAGLNPLDGVAGTKGLSSNPSAGTITTTANGDLIFSCVTEDAIGGGISFTPGSGFTKRVDLGQTAAYADGDSVQVVAGSIAANWTMSPSSTWVASAAAFKSISGSASPSITNLAPTSGPVGTSVTITGTNFGSTQGTSTVSFNGTPATPSSWSATRIVVPVPTGATSGNVVVSVGGLSSNGAAFTVTP